MFLYREDRKMLFNMTLKRVVDFYGHLCPELVIGGRVCEYAQRLFSKNGRLEGGISVVAENYTSALDAIQILLGATMGNQRLKVLDYGKHNYTFSSKNRQIAFRLSLKEQCYGDEVKYRMLEGKIMKDEASLDDVAYFQKLLDARIKRLFSSPLEDLFELEQVRPIDQLCEMPTVYLLCKGCGEQVLKSHAIAVMGKIYCIPCFQQINTGCVKCNLH